MQMKTASEILFYPGQNDSYKRKTKKNNNFDENVGEWRPLHTVGEV